MASSKEAKKRLDLIITKSRIHLYKPIQIAEILFHHRSDPSFNLNKLESYRTRSKRWRDEITQKLVGRVSTSSARFQDNIFEQNAMPPEFLSALGKENEAKPMGIVEAYIYAKLEKRFDTVNSIISYIFHATPNSFNLRELIDKFISEPGLRRSIDKSFEIVSYSLFNALIDHLETTVTLETSPSKTSLLNEFEDFAKTVLGLSPKTPKLTSAAHIFRAGVTNAADRGLDIWSNFGPAIQIKHVTLGEESASDIIGQVAENARIIVVCKKAEAKVIHNVLKQVGARKVQGIVTQDDLEKWYAKCLKGKYAKTIGKDVLKYLKAEFLTEFPSAGTVLKTFVKERDYDKILLKGKWRA